MKLKSVVGLLFIFVFAACAAPTVPQASEISKTSDVSSSTGTLAPSETPKPTATEAASNEMSGVAPTPELGPNVIPAGEMGCYHDEMCLGLEVADPHGAYVMMAEGFVASYENRAWMASMGIKDVDGFMKFLESSKHIDPITGEERSGWIPLVALDGKSTFKILQGDGGAADGVFSDKNPAIVEAGGFFFNNIGFVDITK
jgi:hypothetical protein